MPPTTPAHLTGTAPGSAAPWRSWRASGGPPTGCPSARRIVAAAMTCNSCPRQDRLTATAQAGGCIRFRGPNRLQDAEHVLQPNHVDRQIANDRQHLATALQP